MKITIDSSTVKKAMEAMLYFPGEISDEMFESIRALRTALAQPQEPDSWGAGYEAGYAAGVAEHPAQPVQETQRKPLEDDEIRDLLEAAFLGSYGMRSWDDDLQVFRFAEQAHGIK